MKIKKILLFLKNIFVYHKLKLFSLFFFFFIFLLLLFPYNDLSGFITSKVSELTKNKVIFQFDNLKVFFFPKLGVKLENVSLSTAKVSNLKISTLKARLSILDLLIFKLNYQLEALGFFGGNLSATFKPGKNVINPTNKKKIKTKFVAINFENLDLAQMKSLLPLPIEGKVQTQIQSTLNTQLLKQPEGKVSLYIKDFKLSNYSLNTPFGPMSLPEIHLSSVSLNANINEGVLILEKVQLGSKKNPLNGNINGNLEINFSLVRGKIRLLLRTYQIKVQLSLKPSLQKEFSLIFDPLKKYRAKSSSSREKIDYSFQVKGKGMKSIPKLSPY